MSQTGVVRYPGDLPFVGQIDWLTPGQGGRDSGPPPTPDDQDYAATGFVPPHTVDSGLASFIVRAADRTAWSSPATGRWLLVEAEGPQSIVPGMIVVVTEGRRPVAHFRVDSIRDVH